MAGSNTKRQSRAKVKPKTRAVAKRKPKHAGGRPTKKDAETVVKLIAAYNNGFNDVEACSHAGIGRDSLYRWLKNDKKFSDKIEHAKAYPNKKAKEVIIESMAAGNSNDAKWWLDRRDPEFKPKGELEHKGEVPVAVVRFIGGKKRGSAKRS